MIYLDYSATTKPDDEIIDTFNKVSKNYFGNPNSLHRLGIESKELIDNATKQIAKYINVDPNEIIYTSGATESNNLVIKGVCTKYKNRGNHIITTKLEHSSVASTLEYLTTIGFEVDFVNVLDNGLVDIKHLKSLIKDRTILVTISAVDSEIGIRQPIEEIGSILKEYSKCFFHTDMTQCYGKSKIDLTNIDFASFSGHKIYCFKGIGGLYKKNNIVIETLIHGGKSTSVYRSGTPGTELIVSFAKSTRFVMEKIDENYKYIETLNKKMKKGLSKYEKVVINSTENSIPHILNISILGIKPETFIHSLEEYDIFISTKSACSKNGEISSAVYSLTNNEEISVSSLRISLSHKTTVREIEEFLRVFDICYKKNIFSKN